MLPLRIQGTRSSITVSLAVRTLLQLSNKSLMILGLIRKMSKAKQITVGKEEAPQKRNWTCGLYAL